MTNFRQMKIASSLLSLALVVLVDSQETTEQNNTKNVSLNDPNVDQTIKSALENGSVSEVVVRKDLLLFPVNAPDLVIAHTQEIHAVPQTNGSNTTDGKPTAAEVAEVNEYSLSQLVSTNDTDHDNETKSESSASGASASALLRDPQNASVLEPGKLLEIVSGFNLSHGMATETVPLPEEVQNISIPKQSIAGLLSKSIQQSDKPVSSTWPAYDVNAPQMDSTTVDSSYPGVGDVVRRSIDSEENNGTDDSAMIPPYPYLVRKRSVDSDGSDSDENCDSQDLSAEDELASTTDIVDDAEKRSVESKMSEEDNSSTVEEDDKSSAESDGNSTKDDESSVDDNDFRTVGYESTSSSSTIPDTSLLDSVGMVRRSVDLNEESDTASSSTDESNFYNYQVSVELSPAFQVEDSIEKFRVASTTNNPTSDSQPAPTNNKPSNWINNIKVKLREDSPENMEVAEDIVFRPLFRYRQETRLRQEAARKRGSGYRKSAYNNDDSDYDEQY